MKILVNFASSVGGRTNQHSGLVMIPKLPVTTTFFVSVVENTKKRIMQGLHMNNGKAGKKNIKMYISGELV
jgi:hypothetical protein